MAWINFRITRKTHHLLPDLAESSRKPNRVADRLLKYGDYLFALFGTEGTYLIRQRLGLRRVGPRKANAVTNKAILYSLFATAKAGWQAMTPLVETLEPESFELLKTLLADVNLILTNGNFSLYLVNPQEKSHSKISEGQQYYQTTLTTKGISYQIRIDKEYDAHDFSQSKKPTHFLSITADQTILINQLEFDPALPIRITLQDQSFGIIAAIQKAANVDPFTS